MKRKSVITIGFISVIVIIAIILLLIVINKIYQKSYILDNAYIDTWRDNTLAGDIDLYSTGTGLNEKIYLGRQPIHYVIHKNGNVYTYQESSYRYKFTGIREQAKVEYIKKLTEEELRNLENDLNVVLEENSQNPLNYYTEFWHVNINKSSTKVNGNIYTKVLSTYLE